MRLTICDKCFVILCCFQCFFFAEMESVAPSNSSVFLQTLVFMMNQSIIQQENSYNYYYMQIGKTMNTSKCYGMYGCFDLNSPWTSESRPVSLFPDELDQMEPKYPLYTRKHRNVPAYIDLNEFDYVAESGISPKKPIYLITHGYMEGGAIAWISNITQTLLDMEDCNVIVIDWQGGSNPPYTQAVANIRLVGAMTAYMLGDIAKHTGRLKLDHVHAIGHSLGAHLCGYIGYTLQKEFNITMGRITGLDPAEPHFSKTQPPVRLDRSAAKYVDVIHTDATQFIRGGLGMTENIGHVDYYPNGGYDQPGCTRSVFQYIREANGSVFHGVKKYLSCNHIRSHQFFLESIRPNPTCRFMTVSCPSYEDLSSGACFSCGKYKENCIPFGFHGRRYYERMDRKFKKSGRIQYLMTSENPPFCRAHYRITVQISDSAESIKSGGEIGQLHFTMHSTSDGRGPKADPVPFISGFHQPGEIMTRVVATSEVPRLRAVEIEFKYNTSIVNPLTWRFLSTPKIYLKKVTVESLEIDERITVCPKNQKPLLTGVPQLLIPAYC